MNPADGIRRFGFHRWYERQLIESHVYLVTGFLSLIMVLACVEGFSFRAPGIEPLLTLGLMLGGLALCLGSFRRYLVLLMRAQRVAEQSICGSCGSNGRLKVTSSRPGIEEASQAWDVAVECRKCGHQWTVSHE